MRQTGSSLHGVDEPTMRRLLVHEARVHSLPGRELRDLGDAILLYDPLDPEPFWNRAEAIRWPSDADGFDRRLAELLIQFASLVRQPHIWPAPAYDTPDDLIARLESNGFRDVGGGTVMVLVDPDRAEQRVAAPLPPGLRLERLHGLVGGPAQDAAGDIVSVLLDAFGVESDRRAGIESETVASLGHAAFTYYLVRLDGNPAAVARRATFDGASYLSSIGTATWARGWGLGRAVTAAASIDAVADGSEWTYLGVFNDNDVARRVYEEVGFVQVGDACPDLLLIG
jgi:ribosomal protein S18 acetylase RimI-like enzyme